MQYKQERKSNVLLAKSNALREEVKNIKPDMKMSEDPAGKLSQLNLVCIV